MENEIHNITYFQCLTLVVCLWLIQGLMAWPVAQIIKHYFKINRVFGHKLNFLDCLNKGPLAIYYAVQAPHCPETVERNSGSGRNQDDDDQDR